MIVSGPCEDERVKMSDTVGSPLLRPSVCLKIPLLLTTVSVFLLGHFYFPGDRRAFGIRRGKLQESATWWDGGHCPCRDTHCMQRHSLPLTMEGVGGTCGRRAWASGERQRVITYSLFGNKSKYWEGLDDIMRTAKKLYPGWKVWIYTKPRGREHLLCPLLHAHPHLFICDVTNLPPPLGDVTSINPRMWRFLPMSDGHLSAMVVRDSDSQVWRHFVLFVSFPFGFIMGVCGCSE
ncbi:uncharacterized protein LOC122246532 [Penaeus japonicus]|uniref:uncharacterized protein LOC122246532 n=1 Tax=Penaeus japonicus TaxID=27405 RepID=UPI001C711867|nr:uncharacterized protein LOC122246532 [Penaeus japonicus]